MMHSLDTRRCFVYTCTSQQDIAVKIILRSSWQTQNIGDIAHTPGMLALLEQHAPQAEVTLWPNELSTDVIALLKRRFPRLRIAATPTEQERALTECTFFLHGSGPGLVGVREVERARAAGVPYGFGGITLSDDEIKHHRDILAGARGVFCRDTASLDALRAAGITGPHMAFGPDATFALDLHDDRAAEALLKQLDLPPGGFLCAVPRLRYTPYWEVHPERFAYDPTKDAVNQQYAERDHAKVRAAITAWVRELNKPVLLAPEMSYAVSRLRTLLWDGLPDDVKPYVKALDRYWLTAEAASVYARAAVVVSVEMHSPIIAVANGTPAVLVRQPTDTRKGRMWRDIGLQDWIYEVDASTGDQIAARVVELGRHLDTARQRAAAARAYAVEKMREMVRVLLAT